MGRLPTSPEPQLSYLYEDVPLWIKDVFTALENCNSSKVGRIFLITFKFTFFLKNINANTSVSSAYSIKHEEGKFYIWDAGI